MSTDQNSNFQVQKEKKKEKQVKNLCKEDQSTSFVKSLNVKKESFSGDFELLKEIEDNVLDQQIHIVRSSDSYNFDLEQEDDDKNKLKFLPMLDDDTKNINDKIKKDNKVKYNASKKKTIRKQNNCEENSSQKRANEDTMNYLRQLRKPQNIEERETVLKAREEDKKSKKRGVQFEQELIMEEKDIDDEIRESKRGPLMISGNYKSAIADVLLKRANQGTRGLGYNSSSHPFQIEKSHKESSEIDSIHNYEHHECSNQKTRKKSLSEENNYKRQNIRNGILTGMKGSSPPEIELQMLIGKRDSIQQMHQSIQFCKEHSYKKIEFICSSQGCLRELCSMCILSHKEHIDKIKHLHTHIKEQYDIIKEINLKKIKQKINEEEEKNSKKLDLIYDEIKEILFKKIHGLKDKLVKSNNKVRSALYDMSQFKNQFSILDHNPRMLEFSTFFSKTSSELIKSCISFPVVNTLNTVNIENNIMKQKLKEILRDNMSMNSQKTNFNSVNADIAKYLHWFEWGGRNLHLYDIVNNKSRSIRLVNNIKIPTFSRSIMIPEGKIFLLGGEDPEGQPKREIYQFDLENLDSDHILESKALMPHQKYDFTLCYLDGYIYVICGKDTSSEAVDICER